MPGMTHYSDFEEALELGKDKCLEKLKTGLERNSLDDLHGAMSWWACFNEASDIFSSSFSMENDLYPDYFTPPSKKSKENKKRPRKRNESKQRHREKRADVNFKECKIKFKGFKGHWHIYGIEMWYEDYFNEEAQPFY